MEERETHIPKKITLNGKEKMVYVRTDDTDRDINDYRMGSFAKYEPIDIQLFGGKIAQKQMVIQVPYEMGKRVIRTRLGLDRRPHKVFTGTTLLQHYFANDNYRDGFPIFKQLYLMFGYTDSHNKKAHEIVTETLFTRYHNDDHFWLLIPKSLEVEAVKWGGALLNLRVFASIQVEDPEGDTGQNQIESVFVENTESFTKIEDCYRDQSGSEALNDFEAPPPLADNPGEDRKHKRDREKWRRKSHE